MVASTSKSSSKRKVSTTSAKRAFAKFYKTRKYKSTATRKAAKKHDMCHRSKKRTKTAKYLAHPNKWDYPGFDDGSSRKGCGGIKLRAPRVTRKQMEGLMCARLKRTGKKPTPNMIARWRRAKLAPGMKRNARVPKCKTKYKKTTSTKRT